MGTVRSVVLALLTTLGPASVFAEVPVVYTVNYPLAYFAERIGGDRLVVRFPAPSDVDPAFWKPGAEVILAYQAADLILRNGADYARWTRYASLPRRKQLDTSRSFRDGLLPSSDGVAHSHGPGGDHSHGGVAFTTWLDPKQAVAQARAIEVALSRLRPEDVQAFAARTDSLEADLTALDEELAAAFQGLTGQLLLASHPVYQYLGRRYELDLRALLWEPEVTPDESGWRELDAMLEDRPVAWMLWEAEPTPTTRAELGKRGIGVIVFEPCANRPRVGDYLSVMRANAEAVRSAAAPGR